MRPRRQYGSKQPSRAYHRASLLAALVQRETLEGVNVESMARSFGLSVAEIERAVADERRRRGA